MNRLQFQPGLSLPAFLEQFGTETQCEAALESARWPEGFRCLHCGEANHYVLRKRGRKTFQCQPCRTQTTLIAGSVFQSALAFAGEMAVEWCPRPSSSACANPIRFPNSVGSIPFWAISKPASAGLTMRLILPDTEPATWPPLLTGLTDAFTSTPFRPACSPPPLPSDRALPVGFGRLKNLANQVKQLADRLGYSHVNHFINAFRRQYGYPPGQLRRHQSAPSGWAFHQRRLPRPPQATPLRATTGGQSFTQRWRWLLAGLLTIVISGDVNAAESLQNQRDAFQAADQALRNGTLVDYSALRDYPLYPYLRYRDLSRRLAEFPASDVRDFLQSYARSPLAGPLRNAWLRRLADAKRWEDYLRDAIPGRDPTLECWRRQALLNTGQRESALQDFATLWLRGASLPATCDPVIAVWRTQGNPTPDQVWQRFALAMTSGNTGLAKPLQAELPAADQPLADVWLAVAENPQLMLDTARFTGADPRTAAIFSDGLKRWGKRDPIAAAAALDILKTRYPALAPQLSKAERLLALWIASDYHPTAPARLNGLPEVAVDGPVREWRVRVSLRQGDWAAALRALDQLSPLEQDNPRWRYWRGRTLEALGRTEEAQAVYRSIAGQRDYHGFLAADRLNLPYAIPSIPLQSAPTELDALLTSSPGLQRARELYVLGREPEADAEWRLAIQGFDRAAFQQAAQLAHQWAWHPQAIATIARAESWDDLDLRFPLAYREGVLASAGAETLDPAWAYAIIRQESSFRAEARSPAGAVGLMQIMPATGRDIAQDLRDATATPDLTRADLNIRYGAHYLQRLLGRLQNNPLLATAAYNAGPNKIAQWLPARDSMAADIWAETIPYQETRSYVQRVMEYTAIYTQRLGAQAPANRLGSRMKPVLPMEPRSAG